MFAQPGRGDRIRTCDTLFPKQVLYQTELLPEINSTIIQTYAQRMNRSVNKFFRKCNINLYFQHLLLYSLL